MSSRLPHPGALIPSPTGSWIAYSTNKGVFVMHRDGSGRRRLVAGLGAQLLAWAPDSRNLHFAPAGFKVAKQEPLRAVPASTACGASLPEATQAMALASREQAVLDVSVSRMKDAATAAKAYHSSIERAHQCKGNTVVWPQGFPYNVRMIASFSHDGVEVEVTLITAEGNALIVAQLSRPGGFTKHDLWGVHHALHMTVAAYRAALRT